MAQQFTSQLRLATEAVDNPRHRLADVGLQAQQLVNCFDKMDDDGLADSLSYLAMEAKQVGLQFDRGSCQAVKAGFAYGKDLRMADFGCQLLFQRVEAFIRNVPWVDAYGVEVARLRTEVLRIAVDDGIAARRVGMDVEYVHGTGS